ncbi:hypothetical protein SK128_026538 [Halocaridina rubra]|uniref:Cytosolic endo-beta-N-acetylglucosaminidase n=1 Tax=Halocaridina rubra TaxID=373956 RepID=A0AAN8XIU0_HALRR
MAPAVQRQGREIVPLISWKELMDWKEPPDCIEEIVNGTALMPRAPSYTQKQLKTLVCHDLKGGYLDDRFYSGCCNKNAYRFYNWSGVDIFIYFSHHLLTIPPPCWVNAAHLHGVKVLGTFITEWEAGAVICQKLLCNEESINLCVSQMVKIAQYHHLEGWFINIENAIDVNKIDNLVIFIKKLTTAMHEVNPESLVLWYDSVTKEGKLDWQNELNVLNRCFFDACDGIFLNYTWTHEHLKRTRDAAGNRNSDVFVGVDVFGRNFYEGGKFNTYKAFAEARSQELSAALFAQGWTYENQDDFEGNEEKLWKSLSPYLFYHGPRSLPFRTSFCQGVGEKKFFRGECKETGDWFNLSLQQYQPIWANEAHVKMEFTQTDGYNGGGCLQLATTAPATVRLFICEMKWQVALLTTVVYKWCEAPVPLSLVLQFDVNPKDEKSLVRQRVEVLALEGNSEYTNAAGCEKERNVMLVEQSSLAEKVVETEKEGWMIKTFSVREEGLTLKQANIRLEGASSLLLGSIDLQNICTKGLQ